MARFRPFFPKSHGKPRVDDPLPGNGLPANRERGYVLSEIIFINRNGLRWYDVPKEYGSAKTLYNPWKRWGAMGVFARMMDGLVSAAATPMTVMINAT
jgi:transposase